MTALCESLRSVKDDRCIGFLYWDPLMIHVEAGDNSSLSGWAYRESDDGVEENIVENTTLFDFDGKAIESLEAYAEDRDKNSVLGINLEYDDNGKLIKVTTKKTDIRNSDDYTHIYNGVEFVK
jgi:hypothetical protein